MASHGQITPGRRPIVSIVQADHVAADWRRGMGAKPTPAGLGVDLAALDWQRSGTDAGAFEVAFIAVGRGGEPGGTVPPARPVDVDWVLLRVAGDPDGRVLVYDRTEWTCFIDGASRGEFDPESELTPVPAAGSGRDA